MKKIAQLKNKIASLLRRWAQSLNPESRMLPEGYEVEEITVSHKYTESDPGQGRKFRPVPNKIQRELIRRIIYDQLKFKLQHLPAAWPIRADLATKPGEESTFTATLYVGLNLHAQRCQEIRSEVRKISKPI